MNKTRKVLAIMTTMSTLGVLVYVIVAVPAFRDFALGSLVTGNALVLGYYFGVAKASHCHI